MILHMVFELAAGVLMNPAIMQTLANVWANHLADFALYVFTVNKSCVGRKAQMVCTRLGVSILIIHVNFSWNAINSGE